MGAETALLVASTVGGKLMAAQQQKKIQKQNRQYYEKQAQELKRQNEAAIREEEKRLNRAQATQRARMAASGISSNEGSSAAVLEGMEADVLENIYNRRADYQAAINSSQKSIAPTTSSGQDFLNTTNSILSALQGWQ